MAITTYDTLKTAVSTWLTRTGDTSISGQFDVFLGLAERRIYYGYGNMEGDPLYSEPLRVPELEIVDPTFDLYGSTDIDTIDGVRITALSEVRVTEEFTINQLVAATVAQPTGFLELISARLNSPVRVLKIVPQRAIDGFQTNADGIPSHIAVSGTNFRVWPEPSAASYATIRYYAKLSTPVTGNDPTTNTNDILTNYPELYLYGCLIEAAVLTQDVEAAGYYAGLFRSSVAGLNGRASRVMPIADMRARLRGVRTP